MATGRNSMKKHYDAIDELDRVTERRKLVRSRKANSAERLDEVNSSVSAQPRGKRIG